MLISAYITFSVGAIPRILGSVDVTSQLFVFLANISTGITKRIEHMANRNILSLDFLRRKNEYINPGR